MRLGILSDTHGNHLRTVQAARLFQQARIDQVIHCGDIGSEDIVWLLEPWPSHFVAGNMDDRQVLERAVRDAGQTWHDGFGSLELEGKKVAFLHGDDSRLFRQTIESGRWDLVCHGHTHAAGYVRQGGTLVLNPGAIHRTSQPSVAVVELPSLEVWPLLL